MKRKRGYSRWSEDEETALRVGVNRYGEGKWKRILCDPSLSKYFVERSNVDLKDKWRTMLCAEKSKPGRGHLGEDEGLPPPEGKPHFKPPLAPTTTPSEDSGLSHKSSATLLPDQRLTANHPKGPAQMRIAAVCSRADRGLSAALETAKRRHQGTSGTRAQQALHRELLLEVWKAIQAHPAASLLLRRPPPAAGGSPDLTALRASLASNSCSTTEFFQHVMSLVTSAKSQCSSAAEAARLDSFRVSAKRQFEVLCLADDSCRASLLPLLTPEPPGSRKGAASELKAASAAPSASASRGAARGSKHSRQSPEEDELIAVGVLNMIRDGSSSASSSQAGVDRAKADNDSGEPETSSSLSPPSRLAPPRAPVAAPSSPPPQQKKEQQQQPAKTSLSMSPAVSVPEGCGLDSTSVSAALDKASRLLNERDSALLPVKDLDLGLAASPALLQPPSSPLPAAITSAPIPTSTLPPAAPLIPCSLQQQLSALCAASGPAQVMLPLSLALPHSLGFKQQQMSSFAPPAPMVVDPLLLGAAAKVPPIIPSIPMGAESWYPAYMAWVYSGMVTGSLPRC
mmetsp:Transcript_2756/g.7786  ORF Transcript_2756/g.7786 Transcript_2756/m.7786 type:complete len:569 (-) Transcript_2756:221-1927(-)